MSNKVPKDDPMMIQATMITNLNAIASKFALTIDFENSVLGKNFFSWKDLDPNNPATETQWRKFQRFLELHYED